MKEAYSPVSGCSRKSHYKSLFALTFDQMAPTPKEKDQEEIKNPPSHPRRVCKVAKICLN